MILTSPFEFEAFWLNEEKEWFSWGECGASKWRCREKQKAVQYDKIR